MSIDVFDRLNNLHHFNPWDVSSIYIDDNSRRHVALIGTDEYYFPHTIEQRNIMMEPLGFYQVNTKEIINMSLIDKYKYGIVTIGGREYPLSRRRVAGFEKIFLPD